MQIYSAPLQGFTEAPWRNYHKDIFGGVSKYYAPFMRIEHNEFRKKDIRDITQDTTKCLVPQIISCIPEQACRMVDKILELEFKEIDINFGCPFPPITNKGMGSGILPFPDRVFSLLNALSQYKGNCSFSYKTRFGLHSNVEIFEIMPIFEQFSPTVLTVHPRYGKQQYKGELDVETFSKIYDATKIPLIYNGEIKTIEDIKNIKEKFPRLNGVMIGRGLLEKPSLAREFNGGTEYTINEFMSFHNHIFNYYNSYLSGDAHILAKIKPFWEYAPSYIDKQILKLIKKSGTTAKYNDAISKIK